MENENNPIRSVDGHSVKCPSAYTWKLEDISSSDAGRTEDTKMDKMRIGQVVGLELSWKNLTTEEVSAILKAFNPEYIMVSYARTALTKPSDNTDWSSFPASRSSAWHKTYSSSDYFASFTYDGGKTWGDAIMVRGINGTNGTDGADGSDGAAGSTIQIVYLYYRKTTSTAPSTPSYSGGTVPSGWSLTPTGVTSIYQYEFISQCTVTNGSYGSWSTPVIWAKYGANGTNGSDASVTDENVFNALTSNGTMYGCFTALNNKLYINAAYIKAGTVSSDITFTGKLVADDADISGHISASSGSIGGWYIGVNDGYLRTANGTYGTYKWGDGAVLTATGYCFVALTPKGVIFVLKSGSDYDASETIVETSSWLSSSGGTITPSGGTITV